MGLAGVCEITERQCAFKLNMERGYCVPLARGHIRVLDKWRHRPLRPTEMVGV